jgi:tetratricopeptide (TPR) repeat protein
MNKRVIAGVMIALVAAAAVILYVVNAREDEPFRPPLGDMEIDPTLARLIESDLELRAAHSWAENSPTDSAARASYGSALLVRGFFAHANEQLAIAVRLDPENGDAHRDLGTALDGLDDLNAAIPHWQEAVRLNPDDPAAHNNLANGYFKKQELRGAIVEWKRAVELDPMFAPTRVNLGYAYFAVDSIDAALKQLHRALSLDPALPSARYTLATLWGTLARPDSAIYYLDKGLEVAPESFRTIIGQPGFNEVKNDPRYKDLVDKHARLMKLRGGR